jgi:predicted transglutaminase-like cysteine proteinase
MPIGRRIFLGAALAALNSKAPLASANPSRSGSRLAINTNVIDPNSSFYQETAHNWSTFLINRGRLDAELRRGSSLPGLVGERFRLTQEFLNFARQADSQMAVAVLINGFVNTLIEYDTTKSESVYSDYWYAVPYATLARGAEICTGQAALKYELLRASGKFADHNLCIMAGTRYRGTNNAQAEKMGHAVTGIIIHGRWFVLDNDSPNIEQATDSITKFKSAMGMRASEDYIFKHYEKMYNFQDGVGPMFSPRLAENEQAFAPDLWLNENGSKGFLVTRELLSQIPIMRETGERDFVTDQRRSSNFFNDPRISKSLSRIALLAVELRKAFSPTPQEIPHPPRTVIRIPAGREQPNR